MIPRILTKSISIRWLSSQTNRSDTVPVGKRSHLVTVWQITNWTTWPVSFWSPFLQKIFFNLFKVKQNTAAFISKQTSSQFSICNYLDLKKGNMDFLFVVLVFQAKWLVGSTQLHFNWSSKAASHYTLYSLQVQRSASSNNATLFWFYNHFCSGPTYTLQNTTEF